MENGYISSIRTLDGKTYRGRMFIDVTYEGDLMAAAGDYHVGRESMVSVRRNHLEARGDGW